MAFLKLISLNNSYYYSIDTLLDIFRTQNIRIIQIDSIDIDNCLGITENILNSKVYKLDREVEYPQLTEQLDALFHDIDDGKLDKTGSFYTLLKEVKDTYPKA